MDCSACSLALPRSTRASISSSHMWKRKLRSHCLRLRWLFRRGGALEPGASPRRTTLVWVRTAFAALFVTSDASLALPPGLCRHRSFGVAPLLSWLLTTTARQTQHADGAPGLAHLHIKLEEGEDDTKDNKDSPWRSPRKMNAGDSSPTSLARRISEALCRSPSVILLYQRYAGLFVTDGAQPGCSYPVPLLSLSRGAVYGLCKC